MKYRVYDTKRKKYVTDLPYWILKPNGELAENLYGDEIGRSECIVEFSSGIPDQNGIEIYDGDIVKINPDVEEMFRVKAAEFITVEAHSLLAAANHSLTLFSH